MAALSFHRIADEDLGVAVVVTPPRRDVSVPVSALTVLADTLGQDPRVSVAAGELVVRVRLPLRLNQDTRVAAATSTVRAALEIAGLGDWNAAAWNPSCGQRPARTGVAGAMTTTERPRPTDRTAGTSRT